jgi:hypothetical protein
LGCGLTGGRGSGSPCNGADVGGRGDFAPSAAREAATSCCDTLETLTVTALIIILGCHASLAPFVVVLWGQCATRKCLLWTGRRRLGRTVSASLWPVSNRAESACLAGPRTQARAMRGCALHVSPFRCCAGASPRRISWRSPFASIDGCVMWTRERMFLHDWVSSAPGARSPLCINGSGGSAEKFASRGDGRVYGWQDNPEWGFAEQPSRGWFQVPGHTQSVWVETFGLDVLWNFMVCSESPQIAERIAPPAAGRLR